MVYVRRSAFSTLSHIYRLQLAPRSFRQFSPPIRFMQFDHPERWRDNYDELEGWTENLGHHESGLYFAVHIGDLFRAGRYRVLHKLGNGAFAQVWLAKDLRPG